MNKAYTSTYTIGADKPWSVDDPTHIDGMPLFNTHDTLTINHVIGQDQKPVTGVVYLHFTKKKGEYHSNLHTPFEKCNEHGHKKCYPYTVGDKLLFSRNSGSYKARWTMSITVQPCVEDGGPGDGAANDPELQVGTGLPP
jgi:hypothetical protein